MNLSFISCKLIALTLITANSFSQQVMPLYPSTIPNSKPSPDTESSTTSDGILIISNVSRPTLTVYLPEKSKATGEAIIVIPGGGYHVVAAGHEGSDVAKKLNEMGITAFVLKYRIPDTAWMIRPEIGPIQDAQRSIQVVRENAHKWNVNTHKIGILGFSAGGHLVSTAATHFKTSYIPNKKKTSLRPDFVVLIYPVISFVDSAMHRGSFENLLGKDSSIQMRKKYSAELNVTSETPPTFLVHAKDDPVSVRNTILYADSLNAKGVFSEVLLYDSGGHGFGLVNKTSDISWPERLREWMNKLDK
jgi:acetyl esterase/lipase